MENRDLRDRIEILESVIASTTHQSDFDQLDWRQLLLSDELPMGTDKKQSTPAKGGANLAITEIATELIESKKANRQLASEVENLKAQL